MNLVEFIFSLHTAGQPPVQWTVVLSSTGYGRIVIFLTYPTCVCGFPVCTVLWFLSKERKGVKRRNVCLPVGWISDDLNAFLQCLMNDMMYMYGWWCQKYLQLLFFCLFSCLSRCYDHQVRLSSVLCFQCVFFYFFRVCVLNMFHCMCFIMSQSLTSRKQAKRPLCAISQT